MCKNGQKYVKNYRKTGSSKFTQIYPLNFTIQIVNSYKVLNSYFLEIFSNFTKLALPWDLDLESLFPPTHTHHQADRTSHGDVAVEDKCRQTQRRTTSKPDSLLLNSLPCFVQSSQTGNKISNIFQNFLEFSRVFQVFQDFSRILV